MGHILTEVAWGSFWMSALFSFGVCVTTVSHIGPYLGFTFLGYYYLYMALTVISLVNCQFIYYHVCICLRLIWCMESLRSFYCLGILVPTCKSWCICMCTWVYRCLNGSCISQYDFLILNKQFIKFVTLTVIYCNTPLHVYVQAYNVPVSQSNNFIACILIIIINATLFHLKYLHSYVDFVFFRHGTCSTCTYHKNLTLI